MPPPSNFYNVSSFPYSQAVSSTDFNAGTYGTTTNEVWFKHTPSVDTAIGNVVSGLVARVAIYETDSLTLLNNVINAGFWIPLVGGTTYWFKVVKNAGGSVSASFNVSFDQKPLNPTVGRGQIIINDDEDDTPATLLDIDGTVRGFIADAPGGEIGHALPTGESIWHDRYQRYDPASRLAVFDSNFKRVATLDLNPTLGGTFPLISTTAPISM
jgi:hypothetical protein